MHTDDDVPGRTAGERDHRPLVLVCAGTHLLARKSMHESHLARHLARSARVLYVDPPTSHLGARRNLEQRASLVGPRLRRDTEHSSMMHFTPVVAPKPWASWMRPITERTVRSRLVAATKQLGALPDAVISTWPFCDIRDAFPNARHVYWWTDEAAAAADLWRMDRDRLVAGDRAAAIRADFVMAVSQETVGDMQSRGIDARFLPNGCDVATMATTDSVAPAPGVDLPGPIAGFVGLLNARTDLALLEAVADRGMSVLIVGPHLDGFETARVHALCARPNVVHTGSVPFDQLPSYLGHITVGLVPYADTAFNRASFPLKALEYLAAGRPVVSTGLPAIRWLDCDQIAIADHANEFADAALAAVASASDPRLRTRRREFAALHGWDCRADTVADWLGLNPPQRRASSDAEPSLSAMPGDSPR